MVFKKSQGWYEVEVDGGIIACALSNKLRKTLVFPVFADRKKAGGVRSGVMKVKDITTVDPVAVGDTVEVATGLDGTGMIVEVVPRKSALMRRAAGKKPLKQIIVANVDGVLCVMSADRPAPSWELMDRYLAAAEEAELPATVIITKMDLVEPGAFSGEIDAYRSMGYTAILTSATTGIGVDEVREALRGRLTVFAGKSGVGKTTLLNALQPGLGLRVGDVSERGRQAGKGKHTTTHLELFALDFGGQIVDTPGMRELGLWDISSEREKREHEDLDLAELFVDMRPFLGSCRFGLDCTHTHEPKCAVKGAVEAGQVSRRRYHSYLRMTEDWKRRGR